MTASGVWIKLWHLFACTCIHEKFFFYFIVLWLWLYKILLLTSLQIMEDFFYCGLLHNGCSSDNHQKFPIATGCIASIMHEHSTKPHLSYKTGLDVMQMCRMRFANTADFPDMYIQCRETSYIRLIPCSTVHALKKEGLVNVTIFLSTKEFVR